jgi:acyl-coenzyme A synthetase/AMP-(fatty) acid ligase
MKHAITPYHPYEKFEQIAQQFSHEIAVVFKAESGEVEQYSYQQLLSRVELYAQNLQQIVTETKPIIAVSLPRGIAYMICMLAIWKIGAVYMPLDSKVDNWDRKYQCLKTAGCRYVITNSKEASSLADIKCLDLQQLNSTTHAERETVSVKQQRNLNMPAYVVLSSGSTGDPKVVQNDFTGLACRIKGMTDRLQIDGSVGLMNYTAFDFDASILDICMTISCGACLYVINQRGRTHFSEIIELIEYANTTSKPIRAAVLLPFVLRGLAELGGNTYQSQCKFIQQNFSNFNAVVTMGERCSYDILKVWLNALPSCQYWNGYGPSETCIAASLDRIRSNMREFPISAVLPGVEYYLLINNKLLKLAAIKEDVAGELYIGGNGLGCYLQDRQAAIKNNLNAKKFIWHEQHKLYKTGDWVNYQCQTKKLYFSHRIDNMVKVNGRQVSSIDHEESEIKNILVDYITDATLVRVEQTTLFLLFLSFKAEAQPSLIYKLIKTARCLIKTQAVFKLTQAVKTARDKKSRKLTQLLQHGQYLTKNNLSSTNSKKLLKSSMYQQVVEVFYDVSFQADDATKNLLQQQGDFVTELITPATRFTDLGGDSLGFAKLINGLEGLLPKGQHFSQPLQNWIYKNATVAEIAVKLHYLKQNITIPSQANLSALPYFFLSIDAFHSQAKRMLQQQPSVNNRLYLIELNSSEVRLVANNNRQARQQFLAEVVMSKLRQYQPNGPYILLVDQDNQDAVDIAKRVKLESEHQRDTLLLLPFAENDESSHLVDTVNALEKRRLKLSLTRKLVIQDTASGKRSLKTALTAGATYWFETQAATTNILRLWQKFSNYYAACDGCNAWLVKPPPHRKTIKKAVLPVLINLHAKKGGNFLAMHPFKLLNKNEFEALKNYHLLLLCYNYHFMHRFDTVDLSKNLRDQGIDFTLVIATTPGYRHVVGNQIFFDCKKTSIASNKEVVGWLYHKFKTVSSGHPLLQRKQLNLQIF